MRVFSRLEVGNHLPHVAHSMFRSWSLRGTTLAPGRCNTARGISPCPWSLFSYWENLDCRECVTGSRVRPISDCPCQQYRCPHPKTFRKSVLAVCSTFMIPMYRVMMPARFSNSEKIFFWGREIFRFFCCWHFQNLKNFQWKIMKNHLIFHWQFFRFWKISKFKIFKIFFDT